MADANRKYVVTYVVVGSGNVAPGCLSFNQEQRPIFVIHLRMLLCQEEKWDDNTQYDLYKADFTEQELQGLRDDVLPSMDRTAKLHGFDVVDKCWPEGFAKTELDLVVELKSDAPPLESSRKSSHPHDRAGPPIGLYCPVFDSFVAGLNSTKDIPSSKPEDTLSVLEELPARDGPELDCPRPLATVVPDINQLLDINLIVREGTKPITAKRGAICLITHILNEGSLGSSDALKQGANVYAKHWSNPALLKIRKVSCCPSFILAIAGPWMRVFGAIMLVYPVVQPLTPLLWVGNKSNPCTKLDIGKLSQTFTSLSSSTTALVAFYDNLRYNRIDPTRFYPYLRHFEVNGHRTEFQYNEAISSDKLVFEASMGSPTDERIIIVKFAESYHVEAHRLLAKAGLAPALLFASSEQVGGRFMIVMERVQGKTMASIRSVPGFVKKNVSDALELLHGCGIVFGDLRPPNVMAVLDDQRQPIGGILVDFDWCGKDGEATYPSDINMEIDWPADVGPGTIMKAEHDREMLEKVFLSKVVQ
ncbi:hypothetical protein BDV93DRAFT_478512 [Ceratobasidium sp. AG-I]|nr:hypothetical protein BDV93DRAFT_478512 [Ceratobasidium sp. AG-I]